MLPVQHWQAVAAECCWCSELFSSEKNVKQHVNYHDSVSSATGQVSLTGRAAAAPGRARGLAIMMHKDSVTQ